MNGGAECAVDGCVNEARKAGLCWAHERRRRRGQVVNAPLAPRPSGIQRLTEAALRYAEADGDAEFLRARDNLRAAAVAYARREFGPELGSGPWGAASAPQAAPDTAAAG